MPFLGIKHLACVWSLASSWSPEKYTGNTENYQLTEWTSQLAPIFIWSTSSFLRHLSWAYWSLLDNQNALLSIIQWVWSKNVTIEIGFLTVNHNNGATPYSASKGQRNHWTLHHMKAGVKRCDQKEKQMSLWIIKKKWIQEDSRSMMQADNIYWRHI